MQERFLKTPHGNSVSSIGFFRRLYAGFDAINLLPSPSLPVPLALSSSQLQHRDTKSSRAREPSIRRTKGGESLAELLTCRDPYTSFRDSDQRRDHQTAPSRPDVIHLPRAGWLAGWPVGRPAKRVGQRIQTAFLHWYKRGASSSCRRRRRRRYCRNATSSYPASSPVQAVSRRELSPPGAGKRKARLLRSSVNTLSYYIDDSCVEYS